MGLELSAQDRRMLRDYLPSLSDRQPGFDLAAFMQSIINELDAIKSGSATLENAASADVTIEGGVPEGATIVALISAKSNGSASLYVAGAVRKNATDITITVDQASGPGQSTTVSYIIDGRA